MYVAGIIVCWRIPPATLKRLGIARSSDSHLLLFTRVLCVPPLFHRSRTFLIARTHAFLSLAKLVWCRTLVLDWRHRHIPPQWLQHCQRQGIRVRRVVGLHYHHYRNGPVSFIPLLTFFFSSLLSTDWTSRAILKLKVMALILMETTSRKYLVYFTKHFSQFSFFFFLFLSFLILFPFYLLLLFKHWLYPFFPLDPNLAYFLFCRRPRRRGLRLCRQRHEVPRLQSPRRRKVL